MTFRERRPKELCYACRKPKQGTKVGTVGGIGFGSVARKGDVQICINPECKVGQENLAEQGQTAQLNR